MTGPTGQEGVSVPVDGALQAAFVGGLSLIMAPSSGALTFN